MYSSPCYVIFRLYFNTEIQDAQFYIGKFYVDSWTSLEATF